MLLSNELATRVRHQVHKLIEHIIKSNVCCSSMCNYVLSARSNLNWPLKNLVGPSFRFHNEYMVVLIKFVSLTPHHTKSHIVGRLASISIFHWPGRQAPCIQHDCIGLLVRLEMSGELAWIPFSLVVVFLMTMTRLK